MTFVCSACGGTFEMGNDEYARDEARALWGDLPVEQMAIVCDECFDRGMRTFAD